MAGADAGSGEGLKAKSEARARENWFFVVVSGLRFFSAFCFQVVGKVSH